MDLLTLGASDATLRIVRTKDPLPLVVAIVVALLPGIAKATLLSSCSFDAGTAHVTAVIGSGASPTLERSGDAIWFDGSPCGMAEVTNTDTIDVSASDTSTIEALTISLAGGAFAPGLTPEGDGTDEIEISVGLAVDEPMTFIGTSGSDAFLIRGDAADLNADVSSDYEVTFPVHTAIAHIAGAGGNDVIRSKTYQAAVSGGDGNDTLYSMDAGPSTYDGGPGDDEVSYEGGTVYTTLKVFGVHAAEATIDRGSSVVDTTQSIETIAGTAGNDTFYGSAEGDHFDGGDGNDWFLPFGGDDGIAGGPGFDALSAAASADAVTFDMTVGQLTGEGTDAFHNIEILTGSPLGDVFAGDPEKHGIIQVDGDDGSDVLDLRKGASGQTVYASTQFDPPPAALWATRTERIMGSPFRDRIEFFAGALRARFFGAGGDDRLVGGPLDDTIHGGPGNDRILGKAGTDACVGGSGHDEITGCEA